MKEGSLDEAQGNVIGTPLTPRQSAPPDNAPQRTSRVLISVSLAYLTGPINKFRDRCSTVRETTRSSTTIQKAHAELVPVESLKHVSTTLERHLIAEVLGMQLLTSYISQHEGRATSSVLGTAQQQLLKSWPDSTTAQDETGTPNPTAPAIRSRCPDVPDLDWPRLEQARLQVPILGGPLLPHLASTEGARH